MGLAYSFRKIVHDHYITEEHGYTLRQADVLLEKKLRLLLLDPQTSGRKILGLVRVLETSKPLPSDPLPSARPHFLDHLR